jgi:antitoxin HigA-1
MFMRAVHPGEVLKEELDELGVTPTEFARQIRVPPNRISQIIAGKRTVTGDTALRLGHWFGTDPRFWLNLQGAYEILRAQEKAGRNIARPPVRAGTARPNDRSMA